MQIIDEIVHKIIAAKCISIRDVDNKKEPEEPFVYSSGNRGPGYVMIKGLVGHPETFNFLMQQLSEKIHVSDVQFDFINGNVTGGMIPGWEIRNRCSALQNREIPYVYLREARKQGGHNELITGNDNNPNIQQGMNVLIVEELVNYGETTLNAAKILRECGYVVTHAACILSYNHDKVINNFKEAGITLISLITLDEILNVAESHSLIKSSLINSYREYLADSITWQIKRKYVIPENAAMEAIKMGYNMGRCNGQQAINRGAPLSKVKSNIQYWEHISGGYLYVALDYDSFDELFENAKKLNKIPEDFGLKINIDNIMNERRDLLRYLRRPLFFDLKMWNGLTTMRKIVKRCIKSNAKIINVYPHVGMEFLTELTKLTKGTGTKLFVLTVLTHYDEEYVRNIYNCSMEEIILKFANMAYEANADGIILPPTYLHVVKDIPLLKMCPGIRLNEENNVTNYQKQIDTPKNAIENGADYIVVGSSITKSKDPEKVILDILNDIR